MRLNQHNQRKAALRECKYFGKVFAAWPEDAGIVLEDGTELIPGHRYRYDEASGKFVDLTAAIDDEGGFETAAASRRR